MQGLPLDMLMALASNVACSNLALWGSLWGWNGRTQVKGYGRWVDWFKHLDISKRALMSVLSKAYGKFASSAHPPPNARL